MDTREQLMYELEKAEADFEVVMEHPKRQDQLKAGVALHTTVLDLEQDITNFTKDNPDPELTERLSTLMGSVRQSIFNV